MSKALTIQCEAQTELYHWGISGMKWGVRRYRNRDGSLTDAGKKRYEKHPEREESEHYKANASWRKWESNPKNLKYLDDKDVQALKQRSQNERDIRNANRSPISVAIEKRISDKVNEKAKNPGFVANSLSKLANAAVNGAASRIEKSLSQVPEKPQSHSEMELKIMRMEAGKKLVERLSTAENDTRNKLGIKETYTPNSATVQRIMDDVGGMSVLELEHVLSDKKQKGDNGGGKKDGKK